MNLPIEDWVIHYRSNTEHEIASEEFKATAETVGKTAEQLFDVFKATNPSAEDYVIVKKRLL